MSGDFEPEQKRYLEGFMAGLQIAKTYPDSPDKIDCAVAATLAWAARLDAIAKGAGKKPAGRGRVIVLA